MVELAQKHNFLIVADEVYHFLSYTQKQPKSLASFAADVEQVVSINSFSKILAPGLRLGWIHAHDVIIEHLAGCGLLDSGGGMNPFTSAIVRYFIESGDLAGNIANLREVYSERLNALCASLDRYFPQAEYKKSQGGFFIWVRFPGVDTTLLRQSSGRFQVDIRQGELFSSRSGLEEYTRLSFCHYTSKVIEEGVIRLRDCVQQL